MMETQKTLSQVMFDAVRDVASDSDYRDFTDSDIEAVMEIVFETVRCELRKHAADMVDEKMDKLTLKEVKMLAAVLDMDIGDLL